MSITYTESLSMVDYFCFALSLSILSRSSITWRRFLKPNILCQQICFSISIRSKLLGILFPLFTFAVRWCLFLPCNLLLYCFLSRFRSFLFPFFIGNLLIDIVWKIDYSYNLQSKNIAKNLGTRVTIPAKQSMYRVHCWIPFHFFLTPSTFH